MPIDHQFNALETGASALWRIAESVAELEGQLVLTSRQKKAMDSRQTEHGKKGFLAVRAALVHLGKPLSLLTTDAVGAPQLPNAYCSFSHTPDYAIALVDDAPVGVDIEYLRPKIIRIASKFVHANEEAYLPEQDKIAWLTRLWTAKEALYKAVKRPGLSLHQDIEVHSFSLTDQKGSAVVITDGKTLAFDLYFRTFKDHQLTAAKMKTT